MSNALYELTHESDQERIEELEYWAMLTIDVLLQGVDLMTLEQIAQWRGVRAAIESCPIETATSHTNKD